MTRAIAAGPAFRAREARLADSAANPRGRVSGCEQDSSIMIEAPTTAPCSVSFWTFLYSSNGQLSSESSRKINSESRNSAELSLKSFSDYSLTAGVSDGPRRRSGAASGLAAAGQRPSPAPGEAKQPALGVDDDGPADCSSRARSLQLSA